MARPSAEYHAVRNLIAAGRNDSQVSRLTRVPRSTVREWRLGLRDATPRFVDGAGKVCPGGHDFSDLPPLAYSYLLGLYLGDGWISYVRRGVWRLRVAMDAGYPGIIEECCLAMQGLMPGQRTHRLRRRSRCVDVSMYSKHWPCLFPQHGPGRKHHRPIRLQPWQENLVRREPESFLRGLIHSDGCRVVANDRGVKSVRYHFSNQSGDIKQLFCEALDSLGIAWTRPSARDIAIYRQDAVARLDRFIGPKR